MGAQESDPWVLASHGPPGHLHAGIVGRRLDLGGGQHLPGEGGTQELHDVALGVAHVAYGAISHSLTPFPL